MRDCFMAGSSSERFQVRTCTPARTSFFQLPLPSLMTPCQEAAVDGQDTEDNCAGQSGDGDCVVGGKQIGDEVKGS